MEISRRRLLQAIAAAPLATVPTIVFGEIDRLPTAREVLANGSNITVTCKWTPDQMFELAAYCAAFIYADHKNLATTDVDYAAMHAGFDNFSVFMLNNAGPEYAVFGAKAMLTTYKLPLVPGRLKNFDRFHKEAGPYIMNAVGDGKASLVDSSIAEDIRQMLKTPGYVESKLVL